MNGECSESLQEGGPNTAGSKLLGIPGGRRGYHLHSRERHFLPSGPVEDREVWPNRSRDPGLLHQFLDTKSVRKEEKTISSALSGH